uniref:Reverse transcriptase domain-containing protein n=1 Tax=Cannabis sativa TaxID=3483 RepID=A0A803PB82_CANSA
MEKEPTGIVNVPVDVIDTENEKLLQRDSAMEMEMLELFEDITLEDVVLNKACVGKVMGCKDMPASVVKKILMGIWRNVGSWRMKKCGEGVLGFFFETEEDCKFIMDKRPWLVNGMLLNLKPWPVEGEVRVADFEVARFWVQFHGLPTRCLSNENASIIAKKAGQFVKSDDKSKVELVRRGYLRCWLDVWIAHPFVVGFFLKAEGKEETWIQFKYEKLPFLCFNCGKLAHLDRVCHVPTAMVFPKNGEAVQMYGPWVKSESGRSTCFSMVGKGVTRTLIEPSENALIDRKTEKKGTWRRRQSRKSVGEDDSTLACKKDSEAVSAMSKGVEASSSEKDRDRASDSSTISQKVVFDRMVGNFGYVRDPIPIGPNYLDLPNPDFANVGEGKIPDIGPTLAQSLEIPHSWVCASQRPHNYPDEVPIKWPTNDLEMQKAFLALYGREVTNKFQAQQTLIANPPDLSELINHLLGTHKRKAQTWYIPVPSRPHCSIGESEILIENETPPPTEIEKQLPVDIEASFSMGSFEHGESSKKFWARRGGGRKHAPTSPMRCLSWNCRGLRRPSAERTLRSLIREMDADFIFLSETKVSTDSMTNIINRLGFLNICCIPAVGLAGGMCIAWRRIQINVLETLDSGFKINVLDMPGCASWVLFCIYGPPYGDLKQPYWDRMLSKVQGSPLPWALMGDLNLILEAKEKMGGRPFQVNEGNMLKEFMLGSGGIDLGYVGPPCTWQNARNASHHIRKRLDRVIADSQWCLLFPNASVCHLPIYGSDHAPLCLNMRGVNEKLCYPFRFLEVWTSSKECGEVIDRAWAQHIPVWHSNRFQRKLQITKQELKCWNLNKFGFVDRRLKDLKHSLGLIQGAPVTQSLLENEAGIQLEILELEAKMERIWKQKSRENWLKYGDNNTKFFHASTVVRRRQNRISCIETSPNVWICSRHDIGHYFQDKFQELYQSTNPVINEDLEALFTIKVSPEENLLLCRTPEDSEISEVIFKMHPLKAPGPDGFSGIFYRKYWNTVGPEVCKLVKEFFDHGTMSRQINHTFICLIPKENNASSFDKFRPISLCNFCYKIVARILTDRLKHIMDKLVSPNQSTFIPGRWIAECSVLAQEVNHAIKNKKGKEGVMAVKTDMSKAYDRLEWNFIKRVLKANGFSDKATMLLMACISSVSFSILLNGAPLAPFNPNRGLRQGDPLSPFIFILCSEVLSKLIGKAEADKKLKGIRVSRNATAISHLLYADDAIFYCQASEANATCLMEVFEKYEAWSGQRINKSKSGILFSPNTCERKKGEIMAIMSMEKLRAKEKYLGNPFFFTGRRTKDFQFLKQKVLNRIDGWKAKCLSQAARTTLVSSVLQSIPTYFMSTSLVPKSTCEELDKHVARFWWVGIHPDKDRFCALKSWGDLCQPKNCGGLGFRRFQDMNIALLSKLCWMVLQQKEKLWVNVLLGKYCSSVNAWVVEKKDQDSMIWKSIIQTRDVCLKGAGVVIANGDTDLWTTPWVPWKSIQEIKDSFSYNRIHAFNKVSNLFVDGTRQWNEGLIRSCFEDNVAKAILNIKPLREGKDKLFWKAAKSGNFSVKSAYWIHQHERFNESNAIWTKIWRKKLHPRLQLLMWKVLNDCVPTFGRLRFLNIQDRTCVFCKEETEDLMHIITRCNITRGLWFQSRWGLRIDQMGWNTIFAFISWWADIEDHELKVFAACLLDVLWFWRNKIAHNYTPWDMNLLAKEWLSRATEFSVLIQEVEISPPIPSSSPPSHDCRNIPVFQVDASVSGNDSGIAAILNTEDDWNDTLIALDFGMVHSVIEGELSAISLALSTAASKGFHKVAIESDCAVAIQGLQSGCFPVGWGSYPVFMECMSKCREFDSVIFSCIKRSSNHYADFLARRARIGKIHVVGSVREVAPLRGY